MFEKGVQRFGMGQWALILQNYEFDPSRSGVDLKDKYRNMTKNEK